MATCEELATQITAQEQIVDAALQIKNAADAQKVASDAQAAAANGQYNSALTILASLQMQYQQQGCPPSP